MEKATLEFRQLIETDPDVSMILGIYAELDRVYQEALEAVGIRTQEEPQVESSAGTTIQFTSVSTAHAEHNL